MTKRSVYLSYEGPKDPDNPDDRRSSQNNTLSSEYIEITVSHILLYETPRMVARHLGISSEKSLRTILEEIEKEIEKKTANQEKQIRGLKPRCRDGLAGTEYDAMETFRDSRRHITYFSVDPETHKRKLTPEEYQNLLEMHRKIYPVFKDYVMQMIAEAKNGSHNGNGHSNGKNGHSNGNGHNGNGKNGKH